MIMSSTTLALSSAVGAASACSPLNPPTFAISSALNASATTPFIMSKKTIALSSSSSSSSSTFYSAPTSVNINMMRLISHLPLGRNCCSTITIEGRRIRRRRFISCEVALGSNNSASSATVTTGQDGEGGEEKKIGAKVRVKVPLKIYHVPRVPEVDLTGKEGLLKQYVAFWKGKRISANLPYRVEFVVDIEGRGPVKFLAHLKEDEFEYID